MNPEELRAVFRRVLDGDDEANQVLGDLLRRLTQRARASEPWAQADLEQTLLTFLYELAANRLQKRFPYLRERGCSAASVVHRVWGKLNPDLATLVDVRVLCFQLACRIRYAILDWLKELRRLDELFQPLPVTDGEDNPGSAIPAPPEDDHSSLAAWTVFHEAVDTLPEHQQTVFRLSFYADMSRTAIVLLLQGLEGTEGWEGVKVTDGWVKYRLREAKLALSRHAQAVV